MDLEEFNYHFRIEGKLEVDLWSKAIFVFDTSSLLEIYYYSEAARNEIFEQTLSLLKDRLWITAHTNFEYLKNRQGVIFKAFSEKYNNLKNEDIPTIKKEIIALANKLNQIKQTTQKVDVHPFINQQIFDSISGSIDSLKTEFEVFNTSFLEEISIRENEIKKLETFDEIYSSIIKFFKITKEYKYDKIEQLIITGEKRYEHSIPPGFRDGKGKGEKEGIQKFGDLIIWSQIIELSNSLNIPVILITNDVKDDWCNTEKRSNDTRILSPKDDLLIEFRHKTNQQFWMYSFSQFLYKAKDILNSTITNEALEEVKNISIDNLKTNTLDYSRLYQSNKLKGSNGSAYRKYLRFFEDGVVVGVSSTNSAVEVADWLDHSYSTTGNYSLNNGELKFALKSKAGLVEYSGLVNSDFLSLHTLSRINGYESDNKFYPVKIDFELLDADEL